MVASGYVVAFAMAVLVHPASCSRPDATHTRLAPECVRGRDRLLRGRRRRVAVLDTLGVPADRVSRSFRASGSRVPATGGRMRNPWRPLDMPLTATPPE